MEQRPLCVADENTCPNLAEIKGYINGKARYRSRCFKHRRSNRGDERLKARDKRYTPLGGCQLCVLVPATERHRIIQGGAYEDGNILEVCAPCHRILHRFYDRITALGLKIA